MHGEAQHARNEHRFDIRGGPVANENADLPNNDVANAQHQASLAINQAQSDNYDQSKLLMCYSLDQLHQIQDQVQRAPNQSG